MKLAGIAGVGSGKLGSMVFASAGGQQVVRQYQPSVSNPNTTAQTAQRAKFKLMSQVAAAVSGEIAIPRSGLKSSRNQFVKKNYSLVSAQDGVATLDYAALQFTSSSVALPEVVAENSSSKLKVKLADTTNVSRVTYLVYIKTSEGAIQFADSTIVEEAGTNGDFAHEFADIDPTDQDVIVYAYGMRDLSAAASAKYGNYSVSDGTALANLIMNRSLSTADYQFTATSGVTLFEGQSGTETQAIVSLNLTTLSGQNWGDITVTDGDNIPVIADGVDTVNSKITMNVNVPAGSTQGVVFRPTTGADVILQASWTRTQSGNTIYLNPTGGDPIAEVAFWNNIAGQSGNIVVTIDNTNYTMAIAAA